MPVNALNQSFGIAGEVKDVLVTNGENVSEGQVLSELLPSAEVYSRIASAELNLVQAQNALNDLLEPYSDETALAQAQKNVALARERLDKVEEKWEDINYVGEQVDIDKAWRKLKQARTELKDAEDKRDSYNNPNSRNYKIADAKYRAAYSIYAAALGNYNYLTGNTVDEIERAIIESDLEVARQELADTEKAYQDLLDGPENDNDITAAEARLVTAQTALESAQESLSAHQLLARMDGTVVDLSIQPGEKINANVPVLTLADYTNWIIETDNLTELNVTEIEIGQKVNIVLDAMPDQEFAGEVIEINFRAVEKRGDQTYTVTILLQETSPEMRWGMTAAVEFLP
jgi:multidrug resistance efflux pump